jgi:hypothetical protein
MTNHSFERDPNIERMRDELTTRKERKHISVSSPEIRESIPNDKDMFTLVYKRVYEDNTTETVYRTIFLDQDNNVFTEKQNRFRDKLKTLFAYDSKGLKKLPRYWTPANMETGKFDPTYQLMLSGGTYYLLTYENDMIPASNKALRQTSNGVEFYKHTFSTRQKKGIITEQLLEFYLDKLLGPKLNKTVK